MRQLHRAWVGNHKSQTRIVPNKSGQPLAGPSHLIRKSKLTGRMSSRQHLNRNPRQPRLRHLQLLCRSVRQIDDPSIVAPQIAAVRNPNHHRLPVPQVHDSHQTPEGQRRVARCHCVHVECLPARCLASVEHRSIPGRDAAVNFAMSFRVRLRCGAHRRSRTRDHRRGSCHWPLQPSIRLHCPGGNRSQEPGHCHAGNPHKQPERQRLLGVHVGCFWSNKHPLILPAREAVSSNKFNQMQAKMTSKSTHFAVRSVSL